MTEALSRRERQIMDVLHRLGQATAADIEEALPDAPSYSAVRAHLRTLEEKGHVRHEVDQLRYVYFPTVNPERARKSAVRHLVETFFGGSPADAVAALLDGKSTKLPKAELDRLAAMIEEARKR
ncbi:MAG: BlaI/MecI/CopY family transcriptional regulator [Acidobacteria bacterium]|nr:BlaI/MecI/CopY family transcriptional regulator [Acidobacteriota bacterium]